MSDRSEQIERQLDGIMAGIHTLYDISRALPHPYDAYNDQTNRLLHDFAGVAFGIKSYIGRLELDREPSDSGEPEL
jgi:hypothetical protein